MLSLVLFLGLGPALTGTKQNDSSAPLGTDKQELSLKTMGNGRVLGRMAAFRIHEDPDGREALIWYGEFKSTKEAERATEQWLRGCKITSNKPTKDQAGQVIGDLVTALRRDVKSGKEEFVLVRTYGLKY